MKAIFIVSSSEYRVSPVMAFDNKEDAIQLAQTFIQEEKNPDSLVVEVPYHGSPNEYNVTDMIEAALYSYKTAIGGSYQEDQAVVPEIPDNDEVIENVAEK